MCTVTLQYDQRSALARRKMAALMASGLFTQIAMEPQQPTEEENSADQELAQAFPVQSKRSMAEVITPAMRRRINKARKEYADGQTIKCRNLQEMKQFFDSL